MLKRIEVAIFILLSFELLKEPKYKWMHVVWSGFNEAFRTFFTGEDPVAWLAGLHKDELIDLIVTKGGATIKPKLNLLRTLTDEERAIATRQREFLTKWVAARKCKPSAKKKGCGANFSIEEQAEQLWNEGRSTEALKLLGYL